jgi:hypothetical protein
MAEKAPTETKTVGFDKFGFKEESYILHTYLTHRKMSSDPQISAERVKRDNARVEKWRKMMPKMETLIEKKDKKRIKPLYSFIPSQRTYQKRYPRILPWQGLAYARHGRKA